MEAYQRLEREWARFNGLDAAGMVVCSSGTAAVHLCLEALCQQRRQPLQSAPLPVLMADYNMIAVPRAAVLADMTPEFLDCGPDLLLDPTEVRQWFDGQWAVAEGGGFEMDHDYRAPVIATHVYGRRCDMAALADAVGPDWTERLLIEDLAEAHGIRPHPRTDGACWSFYRNKIVAGEEGGAVWFRDPAHATVARSLRSLGFTAAHDYAHVARGHNYRLANTLAGLVLDSLDDYQGNLAARRKLESLYEEACPAEWRMPRRDAPWVYDVRIPGLNRNAMTTVVKALQTEGIAARHGFRTMSSQEEFRHLPTTFVGKNALLNSCQVFYLPLDPGLDESVPGRALAVMKQALVRTT